MTLCKGVATRQLFYTFAPIFGLSSLEENHASVIGWGLLRVEMEHRRFESLRAITNEPIEQIISVEDMIFLFPKHIQFLVFHRPQHILGYQIQN